MVLNICLLIFSKQNLIHKTCISSHPLLREKTQMQAFLVFNKKVKRLNNMPVLGKKGFGASPGEKKHAGRCS